LDEFGRFLRTVKDPASASWLYEVVSVLLKMYSSAGTSYNGKAYAERKVPQKIMKPCVSLYATSTPEAFFESLTADSVSGGFVSRLLVFEGVPSAKPRRLDDAPPIPESIIAAAKHWGASKQPDGTMESAMSLPKVVGITTEARERFWDFKKQCHDRSSVAWTRSLWRRAHEKALRLSLVFAASAYPTEPVIDYAAADWSCELSERLTKRLAELASDWISDGRFDERQKLVLRILKEAGGRIGMMELARKTRKWTAKERDEVLTNLERQTGQIAIVTEETSGRARRVVALT
jgi:hypothetical protein